MQELIPQDWHKKLEGEFEKDYFKALAASVTAEYLAETVYPPEQIIFNAFAHCPFDKVRVVILGQDPYHSPGQATGLAFSVPDGVTIPPSLQNIYKEIKTDTESEIPESGNLERWAKQGVLLLNSTLTVRAGEAGAHQGLGWETFTDTVIQEISDEKEHIVFLLWGSYARSKTTLINTAKHLILEAPHPSPLSVHRGFFGCKHFSKTNNYLKKHNLPIIVW